MLPGRKEDGTGVEGLGAALCWSPNGSLIAAYQLLRGTEPRVVFFETNGLRHREFALPGVRPDTDHVSALQWNAESDVLAVLVQDGTLGSRVQLWHRSNYHWFMKKEVRVHSSGLDGEIGQRVTCLQWDAEQAYRLVLGVRGGRGLDAEVRDMKLCWDYTVSGGASCIVASIDGGTRTTRTCSPHCRHSPVHACVVQPP